MQGVERSIHVLEQARLPLALLLELPNCAVLCSAAKSNDGRRNSPSPSITART
jgi:hypothetical protein